MIIYNFFKFILKIFKLFCQEIFQSEYNFKYYKGVKFIGKKNIYINDKVYIEKGTNITSIGNKFVKNTIIIESNTWIGKDVEITTDNSAIYIGKNVTINDRCKILGDVIIKSNTLLAPEVFISSGNHNYKLNPYLLIKDQDKINPHLTKSDTIIIEEDCWIGKNVFIKNGVTIGRGAIVGVNSMVTKNIPPYEIWAGAPAKFIKKRLDFKPIQNLSYNIIESYPYFYEGFYRDEEKQLFQSNLSSICVIESISRHSKLCINGYAFQNGVLKILIDNKIVITLNIIQGLLNIKQDINFDKFVENKFTQIKFIFEPDDKKFNFYFGIKHLNIINYD